MAAPRHTVSRSVLAATSAFVLVAGNAAADTYPSHPIRVVIPLSAGSAVDLVPRIVYDEVAKSIGQPFVIENRPGGGGGIAGGAVAKSEPDGYTLLAASNAMTSAPVFFRNLPFDVARDFAAVSAFGFQPNLLIISPDQKITTLQGVVEAARTRPDGIIYAAVPGTPIHLNAEHFRQTMKLNARPILFKGAPEAITEVMTSRVDIYFAPLTLAVPFVNDGKLKALAVTSKERFAATPDVPTTFEQGYPNSEFGLWFGAWAPAKTPREIINKLYDETTKALASQTVRDKLKVMAIEPMPKPMRPEELDAYVREETERFAAIARDTGIAAQ